MSHPRTRWRGVVLLLGLCSGMALAQEWEPVPVGEEWIELQAPGLEESVPARRRMRQGWVHIEHGRWAPPEKALPYAEIYFLRMDDLVFRERTFVLTDSIGERVEKLFSSRSPRLRESGASFNDFEDLQYQRFTLDGTLECIFIRQGRSTTAENIDIYGSGAPIGDMKLEGWYCTDAIAGQLDTAFANFAKGIGVKGFAVPEPPRRDAKLAPRRR